MKSAGTLQVVLLLATASVQESVLCIYRHLLITRKNIIVTKLLQAEAIDYIKVYSKHP